MVVVHEAVEGWDFLKHALPNVLGEITEGWEALASCDETARRQNDPVSKVVAAHVANPVQVWPVVT
jgi:hypothetical protein